MFVIATSDSNEGNAAWKAIRKLLMVDRRGDVVTVQKRLLDSFNCLILPDLQTLKECPALDPNDHIFDMQPQFSVSGFKNNETVLSTVLALIYLGQLRVEAITGIYISRGNGYPSPPHFKKFVNDTIFISGKDVLPASTGRLLSGFPSTNTPKGAIRITRGAGKLGREALRAMHESAFEAWMKHQKASTTCDGNELADSGAMEVAIMQKPADEPSTELSINRASNEGDCALLTKLMLASEENRVRERGGSNSPREKR